MYETTPYSGARNGHRTSVQSPYNAWPTTWGFEKETGSAKASPTFVLPRLVKIDHVAWDKNTPLTPTVMNPGFVDSTDNLVIDAKLQQALVNLIKTKYKKFIRDTSPSSSDGFSIALVDLSGSKLSTPAFAGWGSTVPRYAASTAKIVMLYAVFQLKFELESHLQKAGASNSAQVKKALADFQKQYALPASQLTWASDFEYTFGSGGVTLSFGKVLAKAIGDLVHNHNSAASLLLHRVSYPYIGSLLLQSGITHPTRGGLWLINDYGNPDGTNKPWDDRPSTSFRLNGPHNATALSVVTFFTLMAQRKLVNAFDVLVLKELLRKACSAFWPNASKPPLAGITKRPPAKCGLYGNSYNDVILIESDDGRYRYAACALTDLMYDKTFYLNNLLVDLDAVIRANNP